MIDYQSRKPIYEQIIEKFQRLILVGILETDSQMPSVRSLAVDLSINPNTIQKAYSALEQEGFIYPVKGRGSFVAGNVKLKEKKQKAFFVSLAEFVEQGKVLDIPWEDFKKRAEDYYKEGGRV